MNKLPPLLTKNESDVLTHYVRVLNSMSYFADLQNRGIYEEDVLQSLREKLNKLSADHGDLITKYFDHDLVSI